MPSRRQSTIFGCSRDLVRLETSRVRTCDTSTKSGSMERLEPSILGSRWPSCRPLIKKKMQAQAQAPSCSVLSMGRCCCSRWLLLPSLLLRIIGVRVGWRRYLPGSWQLEHASPRRLAGPALPCPALPCLGGVATGGGVGIPWGGMGRPSALDPPTPSRMEVPKVPWGPSASAVDL